MPTEEEIAAQKAEQDAAAMAATEAAAKADENPELGDAGKETLRKERDARKAAEKERDELKRLADEAAAAKVKADEEQAAKNGEFEKLAGDRLTALDKAKQTLTTMTEERDAALAKLQAREDQDKAEIAAWLKDHKGAVDEFLDYYPGADAPADAQMAWYAATRPKVEKRVTDPVRGNGRSPEAANGRDAKADEAARLQFERQTTRSF
jgi:hypothetical protein